MSKSNEGFATFVAVKALKVAFKWVVIMAGLLGCVIFPIVPTMLAVAWVVGYTAVEVYRSAALEFALKKRKGTYAKADEEL